MKALIEFYDVKKHPMPTSGDFLIFARTRRSEDNPNSPEFFTDVVSGDPIGPMDKYGDIYDYQECITHWAHLPQDKDMMP